MHRSIASIVPAWHCSAVVSTAGPLGEWMYDYVIVGAGAVVDPWLRVHDIIGLRVADASVMPTLPTGNTNTPTIMIAEHAADFLIRHRPPPPGA
jgi:hypothetical protein